MSGVKFLMILVLVLATGLAASAQCDTIGQARAAIVDLASKEMRVFQENGVSFDWKSMRVSTYGEALVVGIPVIEPPEGFHPGDIVAGFVVRGDSGRPDGAYGLELKEGRSVKVVDARGKVFNEIPICDPRVGDCGPAPGIDALPIGRFHPPAEEPGDGCFECCTICAGSPPNQVCEDFCSWKCCC